MLFKKLIEQHRVHSIVAYRIHLAVTSARDQIGTYLCYFLGNEAEAERTRRFNLRFIPEAHRPEAIDCFAGPLHRLDLILKTARGNLGAKLAEPIYIDGLRSARLIPDVTDVATVVDVFAGGIDADHAIGGSDVGACRSTDGDVAAADSIVMERVETNDGVESAGGIDGKRIPTDPRVTAPLGVGSERLKPGGRIVAAGGAELKRKRTCGCVVIDRKSTRLNSSHPSISYAVFCLKKKNHHPLGLSCPQKQEVRSESH